MTQLPSGVYRAGDSTIHALDAAVKLICFAMLLIAIITTDTAVGYVGIALFTGAAAYLAQLDAPSALGSVKRLWWLLALIVLSNFVFYMPERAFAAWWVFTPSLPGLIKGVSTALRVSLILVFGNIISTTTAPLKLTYALETILQPLAWLKLPVYHIATIITLSLRLIPSLFDDADTIRQAQRARGISFERKGFLNKAEAAMPLVLPLFVSAFRRADTLSMAMESRGYSVGAKSLQFKKIEPGMNDWAALLVCAAVCAMQMIIL